MPVSILFVGSRTRSDADPSQSEANIPHRPAIESYQSFLNKLQVTLPEASLPRYYWGPILTLHRKQMTTAIKTWRTRSIHLQVRHRPHARWRQRRIRVRRLRLRAKIKIRRQGVSRETNEMMPRLPLIEKLAKHNQSPRRPRRQTSNVNQVPENHSKSDVEDYLGNRRRIWYCWVEME